MSCTCHQAGYKRIPNPIYTNQQKTVESFCPIELPVGPVLVGLCVSFGTVSTNELGTMPSASISVTLEGVTVATGMISPEVDNLKIGAEKWGIGVEGAVQYNNESGCLSFCYELDYLVNKYQNAWIVGCGHTLPWLQKFDQWLQEHKPS